MPPPPSLLARICVRLVVFAKHCFAQAMSLLDSYGLMQNLPVDFLHRLAIKRPRIQFLHARKNFVLAFRNPQRHAARSLQATHFERKTGAHIEQMQQSGVNRVNFRPPVTDLDLVHTTLPIRSQKQKRPRSLSRFAAGH
jgi:hypothetical protein